MGKIIFGTDGWRGMIAEDYTFESVRRCAQGFSDFLKKSKSSNNLSIVIGHDRF
jgi:phosphomannomutase